MSLRRILLLPLVVTYGAATPLHATPLPGTPLPGTPLPGTPLPDTPLPGTSDVPGYFLNMLMWSGKESERYHGNSLLPVAQSAISLPFTSTVCPSPFFPVMSQCFYTSTHHKLSWENARTFCQQMGGDLAEPIHVNALMVYVRDHYPSLKELYLGASDLQKEGNWTYISGRPVDPLGWMPGEPSDPAHDENCLTFCFEGCRASYPPLNDQFCNRVKHFVCEVKSPQ